MDQLANSPRIWDSTQPALPAGRDSVASLPATVSPGPKLERSMMQEMAGWSQAQPSQRAAVQQQVSMVPWTLLQDPRTRPAGFYNGGLNGSYGFYGANGAFFTAYERRPVSGLAQSVVTLPVGTAAPQQEFLNGIVRSTSLSSRAWPASQAICGGPTAGQQHSVAQPVSDVCLASGLRPHARPLEGSDGATNRSEMELHEVEKKPSALTAPACAETSSPMGVSQPCVKALVDRKRGIADGATSIVNRGAADYGKGHTNCEMVQSECGISEKVNINSKLLPASSFEKLGIKPGRRVTIRPKEWAGEVVWAKLARDPWWPAQVLGDSDPFIPMDADPPRIGAVPVRFFGTYDFAWIESQRSLTPFECSFQERCSMVDLREFVLGINEALELQHTGKLPQGFADAMEEAKPSSISKSKLKSSKVAGVKRHEGSSSDKQAPAETRKAKVMRLLGLCPPPGSPYIKNLAINPNLVMLMQNALR